MQKSHSVRAGLSPPRLHIVVQLGLIEEESYRTIAEALSISESAVKLRMFRGVRILRKKTQAMGCEAMSDRDFQEFAKNCATLSLRFANRS